MENLVDGTVLHDKRVNCYSLMTALKTRDYLEVVKGAYDQRGGIELQRVALKTTSARRIRTRMVADITRGAVLPPVVLGVVVEDDLDEIGKLPADEILAQIKGKYLDVVSIIDGMQRTTALMEAIEKAPALVGEMPTRVEVWLAKSTDNLVYRMLVLNTGQVPWNLSRQLQVVYAPLIKEMSHKVEFVRVLNTEVQGKKDRRTKGGEYAPDALVELYIAFGLRKTEIDTQETLADEFSRLDVTDALDDDQYQQFFYPVLQLMVNLDKAFSRLDNQIDEPELDDDSDEDPKAQRYLKKGKTIFDSKPARIGFVVAMAVAILGRISADKDSGESKKRLDQIKGEVQGLIDSLEQKNLDELMDFLKLDVLSERIYGQKRSAVGRYERAFFDGAFKILIDDHFAVKNLETCWRG